ncbi:MAG TPA: hypothetical protein VGX52_14035 [Burkholderiales bacterium]|nr:hypothetical protein [Burkholderiales bacterium]
MSRPCNVLILGASYGSLLATKLAAAGHNATLVCLPATAELINREGTRVRMPVKGSAPVEIASRSLPGCVAASAPGAADPAAYDLVVLAMQEPQYGASGVRELLDRTAHAKAPCLSLMNMPPLPYVRRLPGLPADLLRGCYTDATVWQGFEPGAMTLCSPDPQAIRPAGEAKNVLEVKLPTNFKAARFAADEHTALLRRLEADIEAVDLPVKLKVYDSLFVPLAKWAMLLAGNYRCITRDGLRSIRDAVHGEPERSRAVYEWVQGLCVALGADARDLVPFEKYAAAATGLAAPSSAARAIAAGAAYVERVDKLVQRIGAQRGMRNPEVDEIVALIDERLAANRQAAA